LDPQIIAAIITALSTIFGSAFLICSSLFISILVYLIFQMIVNKQKAELEVQIERSKTSLVEAHKDQYMGTWNFIKFLNKFILSAKEFYFTTPLQTIIRAYLQLFNHKKLSTVELGLT